YLARDYGLTCYAAFSGCSSESEASFETVAFLASTLEEKALPALLVLENSDQKLARTVAENTSRPDCPVLELNSLQSVTGEQMEEGATYLSLMESNLEVLARALG
ncbi:MAG: zinc ABC transporter substrate-binding protein, partial [Oscillospiraceae bacterium]|nr:zinc ABC transporter substrate-binding protein [Oscillospiraceae bacterium]